ncbi:transcription termination factor MTERF2, chloroplastic [Selaginella moellendorffii]|nr:transcription termination factor MTERF2, chloroplastic [Selaginella moellendorffii]|eukprot:XP_002981630.2 transcription termination factor MTERF2, chloroplastic [Selaginella moellendorffii]
MRAASPSSTSAAARLNGLEEEKSEEAAAHTCSPAIGRPCPSLTSLGHTRMAAVAVQVWCASASIEQGLGRRRQNASSVEFGGSGQELLGARAATPAKPEQRWRLEDILLVHDASDELKRSIVSKRKVAAAAMVAAMQAAKFGPTSSNCIVGHLSHFMDTIITRAVVLKRDPSYAHLSFATRARYCIDKSRVVPLIRWLRHNHLTASKIGELICYVGDEVDHLRLRVEWLKNLHVKGRDLGAVLSKQPALLLRPFNELNHNVALLENAGLKREWMGLVFTFSPSVLLEDHDQLNRRIGMFTELGIDEYSFGTMAFNFPPILGRLSIQEMAAKLDYLRGFGLGDHTIGNMVVTRPHLLGASVEESWQPIVKFLYCLGVERSGIRRILSLNPSVLCLDLSINIVPKVQFLRAIGVHEEVIGQVLVGFPPLLTASLNKRIRPVVRFLLDDAGVSEDKIGKVIASQPEIIGCSLNLRLSDNVRFFMSLGIQSHQLGQMIADFPMLVKYNPAVLEPKYLYLKRVMRRRLEEVIKFPRFFSYALESRIVARHELLERKGLQFRLKQMLACSDEEFGRKVYAAERGLVERETSDSDDIRA